MLPVLSCVFAVIVLLVAERFDRAWLRAPAKLAASSAFVWAAVSWGAADTILGQTLLVALALCWLGDALLLPQGESVWFQFGIGAFLLGHVAYAFAFAQLGLDGVALAVAGFVVAYVAWELLRWLGPHVSEDFRWPVRCYIAVISVMVVTALAAVGAGASVLVGLGAVGFAASDVSVARDRFVSEGFVNGAWGLPAYFGSQLLLAYSVSMAAAG